MTKVKNINKIIFIILIFILLFIIYYFTCIKANTIETETIEEFTKQKSKNEWFTPNGETSKIDVYLKTSSNYPIFINQYDENQVKLDEEYKIINTYKCETSTCKNYGINQEKNEVIIKDSSYVIYNYKKNKALKINLPDAEYKSIEFLSYKNKDYGLSISNINDMYGFYSLEKEKFTTDFKYTNIFTSEVSGLVKGNISVVISSAENIDDNKYYIVSYDSGKVKKESNTYLGSFSNDDYVYYYENFTDINGYDAIIYNDDFEPILKEERHSLFAVTSSGNLIVKNKDENTFSIYTKKGKLVKKSKEYKKVCIVLNDYVVVIDNDDFLKIVDVDGNVVSKFVEMTDNYVFYETLSGLGKIKDKNGIFLVVENTNVEENLKGRGLKYYYVFDSMEKGVIETDNVNGD